MGDFPSLSCVFEQVLAIECLKNRIRVIPAFTNKNVFTIIIGIGILKINNKSISGASGNGHRVVAEQMEQSTAGWLLFYTLC